MVLGEVSDPGPCVTLPARWPGTRRQAAFWLTRLSPAAGLPGLQAVAAPRESPAEIQNLSALARHSASGQRRRGLELCMFASASRELNAQPGSRRLCLLAPWPGLERDVEGTRRLLRLWLCKQPAALRRPAGGMLSDSSHPAGPPTLPRQGMTLLEIRGFKKKKNALLKMCPFFFNMKRMFGASLQRNSKIKGFRGDLGGQTQKSGKVRSLAHREPTDSQGRGEPCEV